VLASICGAWRHTPWRIGQFVAVLHYRAAFKPTRVIVDNDGGLLLLAPSQLVSGSVVAGATYCTRRAVLDDLVLSVRILPPKNKLLQHRSNWRVLLDANIL
jgi:hypothetical protein